MLKHRWFDYFGALRLHFGFAQCSALRLHFGFAQCGALRLRSVQCALALLSAVHFGFAQCGALIKAFKQALKLLAGEHAVWTGAKPFFTFFSPM